MSRFFRTGFLDRSDFGVHQGTGAVVLVKDGDLYEVLGMDEEKVKVTYLAPVENVRDLFEPVSMTFEQVGGERV